MIPLGGATDGATALPALSVLDEKDDGLPSPILDEKASVKSSTDGQPLDNVGDVYDDVRVIDLGSDGKERPIETASDWSLRLISLDDDPTLPVWTFRLWFLAVGLSCFGAVLSEIFAFRPQSVYVSQLFLQTAAYILGRVLEEIIPGPGNARFKTRDNVFTRFMNPGPFDIKEHVGILIMSAAATHGALAINIFAANDLFYGIKSNTAVAIFTLLGSQLLGYGLAGMMRSFLVYPTYCVFPNLIPTVQMFDVLHRGHGNFLQMKRVKFFWTLFIGIFFWQWIPEYIAPLLTGFSVFCLARRNSAWVTRLFGGAAGNEGLGLFSLCFDWNYVGSGGSAYGALFQPLATQLSLFGGVFICIISFIGVYANNVWNAQNFPFMSQLLFYQNGTEYDQLLILNHDYSLNEDKLAVQGLPWFAATQTVAKIGASLSFGATITHMILWNGKQVWDAVKTSRQGAIKDAHYEKMKVYKEVPQWWYVGMFVSSLAMALATNYTSDSGLPWWAFFIAVGFAAIFLPIISTLYAILCYVPGTEDVARMLGAALVPGKPHANMYFTLYAYNSTEQGRSMTRDLKMGQYTKLPPRVTFTMQCLGAVIGALLNYVIMRVVISDNRQILLSVQGSNVWSGATIQSFNSDAIAWGALAKQLYSPSGRYGIVPLSILIGLAVPIPLWWLHKRFPKWHLDSVITPMILSEIGALSGGINSSVFVTFLLCLFSQFYLRKYRAGWFRKYNFLMSAALDGGTEVMVFVYSFAVGGAGGRVVNFPNWALNPIGNPDYCKRLT
ncbi:OPT oligopeptide transporter [Punctularia strigosozonata HHB-11173 SS5]|uniref:OPT oligopeptide transporter n=1 Tax=Punctularia strigosozonata (strain HHB-11173) TaxID=741275 RepID=UPI0004417C99|nr:OPT oligopeptide transporter [Punctularia strigosozonata HHB-11173 SS5]EIN10286.1 OPT oligopeptide transporter [Punctularia strigosozonata HHB-11173 SS5]